MTHSSGFQQHYPVCYSLFIPLLFLTCRITAVQFFSLSPLRQGPLASPPDPRLHNLFLSCFSLSSLCDLKLLVTKSQGLHFLPANTLEPPTPTHSRAHSLGICTKSIPKHGSWCFSFIGYLVHESQCNASLHFYWQQNINITAHLVHITRSCWFVKMYPKF